MEMQPVQGRGLGRESADGFKEAEPDLERRRGRRERDAGRQVTGIPGATHLYPPHVNFILTRRLAESRAVARPGVWGCWNLAPLVLCEDFMVPCYDWDSVIPGIFLCPRLHVSLTLKSPSTHQEPSGRSGQ